MAIAKGAHVMVDSITRCIVLTRVRCLVMKERLVDRTLMDRQDNRTERTVVNRLARSSKRSTQSRIDKKRKRPSHLFRSSSSLLHCSSSTNSSFPFYWQLGVSSKVKIKKKQKKITERKGKPSSVRFERVGHFGVVAALLSLVTSNIAKSKYGIQSLLLPCLIVFVVARTSY